MVATFLTLRFADGMNFIETNPAMALELQSLGWATPLLGLSLISAVYCGIRFLLRRNTLNSGLAFMTNLTLFAIPAATLLDALGDASWVALGVPLLSLQGARFTATVGGLAFAISQRRSDGAYRLFRELAG